MLITYLRTGLERANGVATPRAFEEIEKLVKCLNI